MDWHIYPLWDHNSTSLMLGAAHHKEEREVEIFLGILCLVIKY